jgi:hypothetical protein
MLVRIMIFLHQHRATIVGGEVGYDGAIQAIVRRIRNDTKDNARNASAFSLKSV